MKNSLISTLILTLAFVTSLLAQVQNSSAIEIQEITTPSGIKAWLVEDYTVPLISTSFEFRGGSTQDPRGKEGLTSILGAMMDEGAGDLDTATLKAELEERGIELGFNSNQDAFSGGMRILATQKERAFELLKMILVDPGLEAQSLERIRAGYLSSYQRSLAQPNAILGNRLKTLLYGDHAYGRSSRGNEKSLKSITRDDLVKLHKQMLAQDNLYIGVVGAINKEDLTTLLEKTFAGLPQKAQLVIVPNIEPTLGIKEHISFEAPQTIVSVAFPGLTRDHPDFFAAFIMNHILGGGSFSSRLYEEVREKRGLVYGISTSISPLEHSAYLAGGFSTRSDQAKEAMDLMISEIEKMAKEGPTQEELDLAKKFVFGSYAINNLDTSTKIANVLVGLQISKLGIDYINTRGDSIDAVTLDDVKRLAKNLLGTEPTIVTIGPGDV